MISKNNTLEALMPFDKSAGGNMRIDRIALEPGDMLPCQGYPEERLYYVLDGHGALSVYGEMTKGDTYILRPDVTLYFTPGLMHEVVNTGDSVMNLIVFRVKGGLVPEGAQEGIQKWTSIGKSSSVGSGFWYTDVFNLQENETAREGQYLQVWGVGMRRPQKIVNAEVLAMSPRSSTRSHAHSESNETIFILTGSGTLVLEGERVIMSAGTAYSVPVDVVHHTENESDTPLLCICITTVQ